MEQLVLLLCRRCLEEAFLYIVVMDCDLDGIHFVNGRFDLNTFQFSERKNPNYNNTASFVTKFIPYEFV